MAGHGQCLDHDCAFRSSHQIVPTQHGQRMCNARCYATPTHMFTTKKNTWTLLLAANEQRRSQQHPIVPSCSPTASAICTMFATTVSVKAPFVSAKLSTRPCRQGLTVRAATWQKACNKKDLEEGRKVVEVRALGWHSHHLRDDVTRTRRSWAASASWLLRLMGRCTQSATSAATLACPWWARRRCCRARWARNNKPSCLVHHAADRW